MKRFEETWQKKDISIQTTDDISILFECMKKDEKKREFLTKSMISFFQSLMHAFPSAFELLLLSVSGNPAAIIAGFSHQHTYLLYNSGFDEAQFSGAGLYLKAKSIERAIKKNMKTYNFLQGNERYKYELGGRDFAIYTITVNILKY
jgi:CelD/BcsL family acetyltransferase involved in cellulose biosynthesis